MKQRPWRDLVIVLGLLAGVTGVSPGQPASASLAQAREPGILYVQPGGTSTTCSSWSDACELQAALAVAQSEDEIWVAAGIYLPDYDPSTKTHTGDPSDSFQLVSGVALYGGFAGTEDSSDQRDWETYVTVLSGDIGTSEDATDNSYHVVYGTSLTETAILDGFTITAGNANGAEPHWDGGGMYNDHSSPTVRHCTFSNNRAAQDGGGMHNGNDSNPTLTDVTFVSNTATYDGGGMHNHPYSSPELINVTFIGNTADVDGGGMSNGDSNPTLTNVAFSGNSAGEHGGGLYNWQSLPTLTNCILWGNTATSTGNQLYNSSSTPTIAYSDVQGGCDAILGNNCGEGNINENPLFVDAGGGDLRLQITSPAIDAGDNSAVPPDITTDLGSHPRFVDVPSVDDTGIVDDRDPVDMGAYEAPPPLIYVDADAGTTRGQDGTSWAGAFTDLQDALNWAVAGVEIWVAEGTYKPTDTPDRTASFVLKKGVGVYGGFAGTEENRDERDWSQYETLLSGDLDGDDEADAANNGENSYHVVTSSRVTETAVLDGFTVTGGNAYGSHFYSGDGGGMYNTVSSPTLSNITFAGNSADFGGGMYNVVSSPELTNCSFTDNSAEHNGGGMDNINSNPVLTNCSFTDNSAEHNGGGMYNMFSSPELTNVTFTGNAATWGGGMWNADEQATGGAWPRVSNSILWGNTPDQIVNHYSFASCSTTIAYSDVQGGCDAILDNNCLEGNINENPLFVDAGGGDLRLQITSPAIDAGDNRAVPLDITTDLGGQPRFVDVPSVDDTGIVDDRDPVDMGAYEAQYFTLSVVTTGTGSGTVTSEPPGIDCGADCTEELFQATVITLTATADTGSTFDGWSGGCTGSGDCALTMDSAQVVTGTFTLEDTGHEVYLPLIVRASP